MEIIVKSKMELIQNIFKDSKTEKTNKKCPKCKSNLFMKRIKIDAKKFKAAKKIGITHKAVNFCGAPECPFLEQGVFFNDGKSEKFLGLDEIEDLMFKGMEKDKE